MANISESEALGIVSLDSMKNELRIPPGTPEHDALLTEQIHAAANFVAKSTGVGLSDLHLVRPAIVSAVRNLYDGYIEISPASSAFAWMAPFRSYAPPED